MPSSRYSTLANGYNYTAGHSQVWVGYEHDGATYREEHGDGKWLRTTEAHTASATQNDFAGF